MLTSTLPRLRCPSCGGTLTVAKISRSSPSSTKSLIQEVHSGLIACESCQVNFPILAGVLFLVSDPMSFILNQVKSISKVVGDDEIPEEIREEYISVKTELEEMEDSHIDEDLRASESFLST